MIVLGALVGSAGLLIMRFGGKSIDFSGGYLQGLRDGYLWLLGIVLSWVAGMIFALYVTKTEISSAVTFYVPMLYTFTFVGGVLLLKEEISPYKILGSAFILVGLFFMLKSS